MSHVQEKALLALKPLHAAGLLVEERGAGGECRVRGLPAAVRAVLARCAPSRSADPLARADASADTTGADAQVELQSGLLSGLQSGLQSMPRPTAEQCDELLPLAQQLEAHLAVEPRSRSTQIDSCSACTRSACTARHVNRAYRARAVRMHTLHTHTLRVNRRSSQRTARRPGQYRQMPSFTWNYSLLSSL